MRILIIITTHLVFQLYSQTLNLTRFEEGLTIVSNSFGSINQTALTLAFEEDSTKIGVTAQKRADVCADIMINYWNIRTELLNLGERGILAVGSIINETDYSNEKISKGKISSDNKSEQYQNRTMRAFQELEAFIPVTVGSMKIRLRDMQTINSSDEVIYFVQHSVYTIVKKFVLEHSDNLTLIGQDFLGKDFLVKGLNEVIPMLYQELNSGDKIVIDKSLCYEFLKRRIISIEGRELDFFQKLKEGISIPLNFTTLIENLKGIDYSFGSLELAVLENDILNHVAFIGVTAKDHLRVCAECVSGYRKIIAEFNSSSEEGRLGVAKILNCTDSTIDDLGNVLPDTIDFIRPKIAELKKIKTENETIEFVESAVLQLVKNNFVERRIDVTPNAKTTLAMLLENFSEIRKNYFKLSHENNAIFNRIFCFDYLRSIVHINASQLEGII